MVLDKRQGEIEAGLPRARVQANRRLKGGNCARQLLMLTEVRAQSVVGPCRRVRVNDALQVSRTRAGRSRLPHLAQTENTDDADEKSGQQRHPKVIPHYHSGSHGWFIQSVMIAGNFVRSAFMKPVCSVGS